MSHTRGDHGMIPGTLGVLGVFGDGIHGGIRGIIRGIIPDITILGTIDAYFQSESIIFATMFCWERHISHRSFIVCSHDNHIF